MKTRRKIILGLSALSSLSWIMTQLRPKRDLTGQVALVTGGSRGLGLLIARDLGLKGCRVAICARDEAELEDAQNFLAQADVHDVLTLTCDVSDQDQVGQLIASVEEQFGPIDLLINNAGVIQTGPIRSQRIEDFEQSMDIMFWGGVYPTLNLLPRMLQRQSGHIVNITSVGGKVAVPHLSPYGAAKFAAVGFSEGLAAELWRSGVQVTTVVPGLMRTGSYLNAFFKGNHQPEFKWFALIDNLPIMSMDAEVAAHNIVSAIRRGDTELVLTLPAKILVKFHGVFPVLTTKLLGLINRVVLPEGTNTQKKRGMDIQENIQAPFFNFATTWGRSAARRLNQYEDSLTEQEQE